MLSNSINDNAQKLELNVIAHQKHYPCSPFNN